MSSEKVFTLPEVAEFGNIRAGVQIHVSLIPETLSVPALSEEGIGVRWLSLV